MEYKITKKDVKEYMDFVMKKDSLSKLVFDRLSKL
ncbi:MAG: hypothetical protein AMDU4_FER2C00158G0011 [Ferroplasma sp. Type II]|jgi:hypothetical protein|nr:MAG: hypothetical protein AMDU4_FER2C00158G0011 [Ferroplasma sp. Type II]